MSMISTLESRDHPIYGQNCIPSSSNNKIHNFAMPKRGAFIVIEGLDRSGKTTQTSLLHDRLQSSHVPIKLLKFPGEFQPGGMHSVHRDGLWSCFIFSCVKTVDLDRTTAIGKMIDSYLRSQSDLDDRAIHLLFSANRWELAYAQPIPSLFIFILIHRR